MLSRSSGGELRTEMITGWWPTPGTPTGEIKVSPTSFKAGFRQNTILPGITYKLKKGVRSFFQTEVSLKYAERLNLRFL